MKRIVGMVLAVMLAATCAAAQDTPAVKAPDAAVQALAPADSQALAAARIRVLGLVEASQAVQEKLDAAVADFNRAVQRVQAAAPAGMELGPDLTHYVPKKADPPKKETPTKETPKTDPPAP